MALLLVSLCEFHFQVSQGCTVDEMPSGWEKGLGDLTPSRKTEHKVEGWACNPTVKNSDPEESLSERTAGTKVEKSLRKRMSSYRPKMGSIPREATRPDTITHAVLCSQKGSYQDCPLKAPTSSRKSQMQIFIPKQWNKLVTPVVELGKSWEKVTRWANL